MTQPSSVLADRPRLTQTSYRQAISETVSGLQKPGQSDREFAEEWGVSSGTVGNCRNKNNDLSGLPLLKIGKEFGPGALGTILALIGAKAVPVDASCFDTSKVPHDVAACLPLLIELLADGVCCEHDTRKLDQAGVIDRLGSVADMLRGKRDALRLKAVA